MQPENPLISVIIPVYNVGRYLEKCIASVCNQSYKEIEIVIIDDGSTDNCPTICDEAASRDNRIRVIHQKNGGRSVARNRGIEESQGEYLLFADGDDWIDDKCVQTLYEALKEAKASLAVARYRLIYKDKIIDESTGEALVLDGEEPLEFCVKGHKGYQNANSVCVKLYAKELLKGIRFVEGRYFEDIMFVTKVYHACRRCVYLDHAFYNYNIGTETSITFSGVNELTFRDEIPTFEEKEIFLTKAGREDLAKEYSFFKYQKLITYYRDCWQCRQKEYKKRIKNLIGAQKNRIQALCREHYGTRLERVELKLFLFSAGLYMVYYRMLTVYGKVRNKRKEKGNA